MLLGAVHKVQNLARSPESVNFLKRWVAQKKHDYKWHNWKADRKKEIRRRKKCSSSKHESLSLTRKSYLSITNKWQVFQTLLRDKQEKQELFCILPKEFSISTVQVYTSQHTFPYTMFELHCFTSIIRALYARKDKSECDFQQGSVFLKPANVAILRMVGI